jgi:hypothetical protein
MQENNLAAGWQLPVKFFIHLKIRRNVRYVATPCKTEGG